jgi:hypothetical protein
MSPTEFDAAYEQILDRLTTEERELLETVLEGAQVNYTALYMVFSAMLGLVGGWALHSLFAG